MLKTRFLLLACFLIFNCAAHAQGFPSPQNYPRVNGSTSTALLGNLLAARALNLDVQLRRMPFSSYGATGTAQLTLPLQMEKDEMQRFRALSYRNAHAGTGKAYLSLIAGKSDLILVARKPSKSEIAALEKAGFQLDLRPVALDAFVFLVNAQNPVSNLSLAQIRAIYSGKTRLWRALGGADFPILALSRPRDSGSEELMNSLVMRGKKMGNFPPQTRLSEMGETIERVAQNENAIGYSVFYFERFMAPNPKNKLLQIDGIAPTLQNLASKKYPLSAPVYCVTRRDLKPDSSAAKLRDWLLSSEGQKLIESSGYVPLSP